MVALAALAATLIVVDAPNALIVVAVVLYKLKLVLAVFILMLNVGLLAVRVLLTVVVPVFAPIVMAVP